MAVDACPSSSAVVETHYAEDVEAMASAMSDGLRGEYVQLESTPFRGRWTSVRFASFTAQFGLAESAIVRRLMVPPDRCAFMVPLAAGDAAR